MADEIAIANAEFREKNRLENQFRPEVQKLQRRIVKKMGQLLAQNGSIITKESLVGDWEELLLRNYLRAEDSFKNSISARLDSADQLTQKEKELLHIELMTLFRIRAREQADIIATTDAIQAGEAFAKANLSSQIAETAFTLDEIVGVAISLFTPSLAARTGAITSLETQVPVETTKNSEARALVGDAASSISNKIWVTRGDEKVRPAHVRAHLQPRLSNKPFDVGGEQLMFPGDMSLGASLSNTINCRCSAIFDTDKIGAIRRAIEDLDLDLGLDEEEDLGLDEEEDLGLDEEEDLDLDEEEDLDLDEEEDGDDRF